jgi:hypothetical protein
LWVRCLSEWVWNTTWYLSLSLLKLQNDPLLAFCHWCIKFIVGTYVWVRPYIIFVLWWFSLLWSWNVKYSSWMWNQILFCYCDRFLIYVFVLSKLVWVESISWVYECFTSFAELQVWGLGKSQSYIHPENENNLLWIKKQHKQN